MGLKEELTKEELDLLDKMEADLFKVGQKDAPREPLYHYTTPEALWGIVGLSEH